MPKYEEVDPATKKLMQSVIGDHHERLLSNTVEIELLFAFGAKKEIKGDDNTVAETVINPAIKVRGQQVAGRSKVISAADRAAGHGDAQIILDGDRWGNWSLETQKATLDHFLTSLELITNVDGEQKYDDNGRPKLRIRHADYRIEGYGEVANRHGENSIEVRSAETLYNGPFGQLVFQFDMDSQDKAA